MSVYKHCGYIIGDFHQGSDRFSVLSRGRQCVPSCLAFDAKSSMKPVLNFTKNDSNLILIEGDALYKHVKQNNTVQTDYFTLSDLPLSFASVLVTIEPCKHPTVMKDMCAECGADLREEAGLAGERKEPVTATVAMVHSIPELIISEEQAREIGREDEDRLMKTKKLVLLVDLDQTLIHTTNDSIPANLKGVFHYQLRHGNGVMWYHTRIRPGTQHFLETVSKMYELHICTFGVRMYAHTIARYLDPEEKYFSHRILSRDECFDSNSKTANLKALFPCGDKMVCIIDDREDVWNFAPNLIHVKPYRFFQGTADINAPPGLAKTEHDLEPVHHRVRRVSRSHSDDKEGVVKVDNDKTKGDNPNSTENGDSKLKEENVKTENEKEAEGDQSREIIKNHEILNKNDTIKPNGCHGDSDNNNKNVVEQIGSQSEKVENIDQSEIKISNDRNQSENDRKNDNGNSVSKSENHENISCQKEDKDLPTQEIKESNVETTQSVEETKTAMEVDSQNSGQEGKGENETNVEEHDENVETTQSVEETKTAMEVDSQNSGQEGKGENETNVEEHDENVDKNVESLQDEDEEIEWEDEDDYLLYLEEILTRIHDTFFDFNDQLKSKNEKNQIPDLKDIISYIKRKVLQGVNIVFSGVFPTNIQPEKSRAYIVAKVLGANVHTNIIPKSKAEKGQATTHLVAAKPGTTKVNMALKAKGIKIVNANWLWSCAERYEHVDERLFPLDKELNKMEGCDSPDVTQDKNRKRKSDPDDLNEISNSEKRPRKNEEESSEVISKDSQNMASTSAQANDKNEKSNDQNPMFSSTYNPLLAFSDDDLACMDKEVEEIMDEDPEDVSSEDEEERDSRLRSFVLSSGDNASSSEDSLSGDLPRGWKKKDRSGSSESLCSSDHNKNNGNESENDLEKFENTVDAFAPDTESDNESIGSMDDEMAAAIEKEFLEL